MVNRHFEPPRKLSISAKYLESNVTTDEFENAVSNAKGKTPGFDRVSYPMLRNTPFLLKKRIVDLYNEILSQGIYPQSWKVADAVPIAKPLKPSSELTSYRPISLLPCLGKVLEKILAK